MKVLRRALLGAAWILVGLAPLACSTPGGGGPAPAPSGATAPAPRPGEAGKVVVYTPFIYLTADELAAAFTRKTGIEVEQIQEGTTRVFSRLRSEKNHPRADVWLGGGGTIPFMAGAREGLLEPYTPKGHERLPLTRGNLVLRDGDWRWVGVAVIALGYAYNPQKLPPEEIPKEWADLADPRWKGQVEMWDPAESGTSMLFLESALLRAIDAGRGEEAGWDYLAGVFRNLKRYTREGKPAFAVARGETQIGIHFQHQYLEFLVEEAAGAPVAQRRRNIAWYLPPASPVLTEPVALVKGGPNPEGGQRFIDFCLSPEGQRIVNRFFFSLDPRVPPPADSGISLDQMLSRAQKLDPEWMAENYDRVRKKWQNDLEATAGE